MLFERCFVCNSDIIELKPKFAVVNHITERKPGLKGVASRPNFSAYVHLEVHLAGD